MRNKDKEKRDRVRFTKECGDKNEEEKFLLGADSPFNEFRIRDLVDSNEVKWFENWFMNGLHCMISAIIPFW